MNLPAAKKIPLPPKRRWATLAVIVLLGLAMGMPAWAADAEAAAAAPRLEPPTVVFSLFRVLGALALVCAVFIGGVWMYRNWARLTVQRGRAPKLNIVEVRSLGPRHALYVIGYEQQRFLLASGPTGISLLTALPSAASAEADLPPAPAAGTFADALARVLAPGQGNGGVPK
jgi:flagellar biogenesis protein FliO